MMALFENLKINDFYYSTFNINFSEKFMCCLSEREGLEGNIVKLFLEMLDDINKNNVSSTQIHQTIQFISRNNKFDRKTHKILTLVGNLIETYTILTKKIAYDDERNRLHYDFIDVINHLTQKNITKKSILLYYHIYNENNEIEKVWVLSVHFNKYKYNKNKFIKLNPKFCPYKFIK